MASNDLDIATETVDAPKEKESRHGSRRHDRDRDRSNSEHKRSRSRRNGYDKGDEVEVEGKRERSRRHKRDEEVEEEGKREGRSGSRPRRHEREVEDEVERKRSRSLSRSRRHDRDDEVEMEGSRKYDRGDEVERERSRRSGSRSRRYDREDEVERERLRRSRSRSRRYDREDEVERERPRKYDREDEVEQSRRSGSRSAKYDREDEGEKERSRSERDDERRSGSRSRRHDKEVEMEMERARSRDRAMREKEAEREAREIRKLKEKKEALEPEADPERDQRTVFAYQMPLKASERDVYEFFSQVGKVRDVRLIMDRNSRRSKGVGYIEFYDVASVEAALKLSGQPLLGQPVMVKHSEAEKNLTQSTTGGAGPMGPGAERKLYVGNLHFNMTEDHLRQIFEAFGPVELVQLPLDLETGHCKGFGFVQFAHLEHAKLAQQSLNGTLEIAGRIVKVSNVTEHVPVQDAGSNATDFDDDDGGGLALNARSRALLMQKLDRTGTANSIAGSLAVAGPVPLPVNGKAAVSVAQPSLLPAPVVEPIGDPSDCILLKNMFDPSTETEPEFDLDIKDDVQDECSKFGVVRHIFVDKNSKGHVYLRFGSVAAAASCQCAMHMRWFARRCISATFMRPQDYEEKFGKDAF